MSSFSRLHMYLAANSAQVMGESTDAGYADQILLTGFNWELSRGKDTKAGTDRGEVEPGAFEFSKPMDKASTAMLTHMRNGEELSALVTLASHPDSKDAESSDYMLVFGLEDVRITDYKVDACDGEKGGEIKEDWTFTYSKLTVRYTPPGAAALTSEHIRKSETGRKQELEEILGKFASLKPPQQISVRPDLEKLYEQFK